MHSELLVKEYELYRSVYCGLCASLGKKISCTSRLVLSYDFVFLALVRMALSEETGKIEKKRCVAHPTKKRSVLTGAESIDYSAKMSAVLTYYKIKDDITDKRGIKKLPAYFMLPEASRMRRRANLSSEAEEFIRSKLGETSLLEKMKCDSIDRAAEPFGELMAFIASYGYENSTSRYRIAREIGRHIGRFIYIADAVDDLASDMKSGSYNPFVIMNCDDPMAVFSDGGERIKTSLMMELTGASAAVELIDDKIVPEYVNIIKNILYFGLPEKASQLIRKYTADADNGENKK